MVDTYDLQDDVYVVEYQKLKAPLYNPKAIIDLNKNLGSYKLVHKLIQKFTKRFDQVNLPEYEAFYNELKKLELDFLTLKLSKIDVINWSKKISNNERFFNRFYKRI